MCCVLFFQKSKYMGSSPPIMCLLVLLFPGVIVILYVFVDVFFVIFMHVPCSIVLGVSCDFVRSIVIW